MAFINTSKGYINTDHIMWIRTGAGVETEEDDLLRMSDAQLISCRIFDRFFEEAPAPVTEPKTAVGPKTAGGPITPPAEAPEPGQKKPPEGGMPSGGGG